MQSKCCKWCGKEFKPEQRTQKYCEQCRKLPSDLLSGKVFDNRKTQNCANCNKDFIADRKKKYCADECQKEYSLNKAKVSRKMDGYVIPKHKTYEYTCACCGVGYTTTSKEQKYCGIKCYGISKKGIQRITRTYVCQHCGKTYHPRESKYDKYCSRECYFEYRRVNPRIKIRAKSVKYKGICTICAKEFEGRKNAHYCSEECTKKDTKRKSKEYWETNKAASIVNKAITKICKECGNSFTTNFMSSKRHYCSDICSRKHGRRVGKGIRRARIYGVGYESISPIEIFKRDGWKCQLCGAKTPYKLRGTCEDNAPELDHLVPLSLGGQHNKTNVQRLCRKCNISKGATIQGQLILFG